MDVVAKKSDTEPLVGIIEISTPFHNLPSVSNDSTLELISASIDKQELSLTFRIPTFSGFTATECDTDQPGNETVTITPTETRFENGALLVSLKIVDLTQKIQDTHCSSTTSSNSDSPKSESESSILTNLEAARDESVPPFEDTEYLQCLYDSCETFAEMSEKINMAVSDETVRRYMIDADIHSPSANRIPKTIF
ncbi:hypothetical protein [Halobellus rarus]|uniref:Uncharacterized protein n=1 Tax=Halobellus rarus TaxID=1126237 RepID=A0ABD6CRQ8_9EURY|nr:hypothetical protein [Halobellus rarus]